MKFSRINDILALTDWGDDIKNETVEASFEKSGSGNYVKITSVSTMNEIWIGFLNDENKCNISSEPIKNDGAYLVTLYEKTDDSLKPIATGSFSVFRGFVSLRHGSYHTEIARIWKTLVFIYEKLGVDEAALDTLITGYITE